MILRTVSMDLMQHWEMQFPGHRHEFNAVETVTDGETGKG